MRCTFHAVFHVALLIAATAAASPLTLSITDCKSNECSGAYDPFGAALSCTVHDGDTGALLDNASRDSSVPHPNYRFTWAYTPAFGTKIQVRVKARDGDLTIVDSCEYL